MFQISYKIQITEIIYHAPSLLNGHLPAEFQSMSAIHLANIAQFAPGRFCVDAKDRCPSLVGRANRTSHTFPTLEQSLETWSPLGTENDRV